MSVYGDPRPTPACVAKYGLEAELRRLSTKALVRDLRADKPEAWEHLATMTPEAREAALRVVGRR